MKAQFINFSRPMISGFWILMITPAIKKNANTNSVPTISRSLSLLRTIIPDLRENKTAPDVRVTRRVAVARGGTPHGSTLNDAKSHATYITICAETTRANPHPRSCEPGSSVHATGQTITERQAVAAYH
jgi:hypothetical protein